MGDLAEVDWQTYLVAPVSDDAVDALAAFEAEGEDRESALCDEPSVGKSAQTVHMVDLEKDAADEEWDCPDTRARFAEERCVAPRWRRAV